MDKWTARGPLTLALLVASAAAQAQLQKEGMSSMKMPAPGQQAPGMLTDAVVQKIDHAGGVIVLKRGDIPNLAMTMGFDVADKKMLDPVKPGDKVRFHVVVVKGKPTVTQVEAVRRSDRKCSQDDRARQEPYALEASFPVLGMNFGPDSGRAATSRKNFDLAFGKGKVLKDGAVDRRTTGAGGIAASHEARKACFEFTKLIQLFSDCPEVYCGDVSHFCARAVRLVDQTDEFTDLFDGESKISASANEGQSPCRRAAIQSLAAVAPICRRQEPDLLVVPDGRHCATRLFGNRTDGKVIHCIHNPILVSRTCRSNVVRVWSARLNPPG
jgi:Cu(I)/Ag(I) efflux system membrane protein CusA/SilA